MFNKIKAFKESLSDDVVFVKREYLLTLAVCILGGILFGMIVTPKKALTIGSFNGCGWNALDDDDEDDAEDKE